MASKEENDYLQKMVNDAEKIYASECACLMAEHVKCGRAMQSGGSKREEWSDFRATSDQSARSVNTGTDVLGKNRLSSGILLLKSVNCVL